jgi:hypothetical protein
MEIVLTAWALDSYLNLKKNGVFSPLIYKNQIRPDVLLLENFPNDPHFQNGKFWSRATDRSGNFISDGYKLKWHNFGNGKIQLRLTVGIISNKAFLCEAYVKSNINEEHRKLAKFKVYLELIRRGQYTECGRIIK